MNNEKWPMVAGWVNGRDLWGRKLPWWLGIAERDMLSMRYLVMLFPLNLAWSFCWRFWVRVRAWQDPTWWNHAYRQGYDQAVKACAAGTKYWEDRCKEYEGKWTALQDAIERHSQVLGMVDDD